MIASVRIVGRIDKKNSKGEIPIYLRLIKNRKASYISTGVKILEKHWDDQKNLVKNLYPNSTRQNHYLNQLRLRYEDLILKEETSDSNNTLSELKFRLNGGSSKDFFLVSEELIQGYRIQGKIGTFAKTKSIVSKLKTFTKSDRLDFKLITQSFIEKYENYLRTTLNNKTNTVCKDLKFIRRVINEAYRRGIIDSGTNPFNRITIKTAKSQRTYLTENELKAIELLDCPSSRLQLVRDMFIFSAYTGGIRISDVLMLRCNNYDGSNIHFTIQKTQNQLSIRVPLKASEILQNYIQNKKQDEFIFPILSKTLNVKSAEELDGGISSGTAMVNKCLKKIAELSGIEKVLSFHVSRHTWGTLALRKGISLDKVSKLMGHASVRETQVYAKIMSEELDKAMELFNT